MSSIEDSWTVSGTEALEIILASCGHNSNETLEEFAKFHPEFTLNIFGEDEQIFGYQGLKISLTYNASNMQPLVQWKYDKKFPTTGETEADDIEATMKELLPAVAFQRESDFRKACAAHFAQDWTPPGQLVTSIDAQHDTGMKTYEVWKGTLDDPAMQQLKVRFQFLVKAFIDGGSYINDKEDADRWTCFCLFEKRVINGMSRYIFVGFSTVYRFFIFDAHRPPAKMDENFTFNAPFDINNLASRDRISQFLILPPWRGKGLGQQLYKVIYGEYLAHPGTVEITAELPNDDFDLLRWLADLKYLRTLPEFHALEINTKIVLPTGKGAIVPNNIIDEDAADKLRRKVKMARRQFRCCLEMQLMSKLPESIRPGYLEEDDKRLQTSNCTPDEKFAVELWRILVKKRIYVQNMDVLGSFSVGERIAKLHGMVFDIAFDWRRVLESLRTDANFRHTKPGTNKRKLDESETDQSSDRGSRPRLE